LRVLSGLPHFATSEDAIASVLAHELAHITLRHHDRFARFVVTEKRKEVRSSPLALRREYEREADITGLKILFNAGYDPTAAVDHLRAVEALASQPAFHRRDSGGEKLHDAPEARVRTLREQISRCAYSLKGRSRTPVDARVREELARYSPTAPAASP
jgi:predicted Zn-dependent protease